jgi:predicted HTH domain antitoxin
MTIELPDVKVGSQPLTGGQARIEIACGLYAGRKVSMGRAAQIAGIPYIDFMDEVGRRGICLNYGMDDLQHDIETIEKLSRKAVAA